MKLNTLSRPSLLVSAFLATAPVAEAEQNTKIAEPLYTSRDCIHSVLEEMVFPDSRESIEEPDMVGSYGYREEGEGERLTKFYNGIVVSVDGFDQFDKANVNVVTYDYAQFVPPESDGGDDTFFDVTRFVALPYGDTDIKGLYPDANWGQTDYDVDAALKEFDAKLRACGMHNMM